MCERVAEGLNAQTRTPCSTSSPATTHASFPAPLTALSYSCCLQIGGGLEDHLVGVTHECDYPPAVVAKCERVTTSEINPHTMSQVLVLVDTPGQSKENCTFVRR